MRLRDGKVFADGRPSRAVREVVESAYRQRIPLFAQGFYRTPEIHYDPKTGPRQAVPLFRLRRGGFRSGNRRLHRAARLLRADLLEDVGDSLSPLVDRGQIEGGFMQGAGWLTIEELVWDAEGRLATDGASTYKLPSWSEMPDDFRRVFLAARRRTRGRLRQ